MWWLPAVDNALPAGDAIYVGGIVVLGVIALSTVAIPNAYSSPYKAMIRYIEEGMPSSFDEPGIGTAADFYEVLENVLLVYDGLAENHIGNATMFQKGDRPAMAGKQVEIPGIKAKHVFFIHKNDL